MRRNKKWSAERREKFMQTISLKKKSPERGQSRNFPELYLEQIISPTEAYSYLKYSGELAQ